MTNRIGVFIGYEAIRAVLFRHGRVTWAAEAERVPGERLADAIAGVLGRAPRVRLRRPGVVAAVGPHAAQLKRIGGLPATADPSILAAIVRENSSAFFLRVGTPLSTTGVRRAPDDTAWAAAIEAPVLDAIREACDSLSFTLHSVVPSAVALQLVVTNQAFAWGDGPVVVEVVRSGGDLESVRQSPAALRPLDTSGLTTVPALGALGDDAGRFADAFGAALITSREVLGVRPGYGRATGAWSGIKLPVAVAACALLFLLASPLGALWLAQRSEARLRALQGSARWEAMATAEAELRPVSTALDQIAAFLTSRPVRSSLLGSLAQALPDGSALAHLQVDGADVRLTVLTTDVDEVLRALRKVRGVTAATLADSRGSSNDSAEHQAVTITLDLAQPVGSAATIPGRGSRALE